MTGCGILAKEVRRVVQDNDWPIRSRFLCSSLHADLDRLYEALDGALAGREGGVVLYGSCHPFIDRLMGEKRSTRVESQNCVEMLLGREGFTAELSAGAFFLLEDWVRRWDYVSEKVFDRSDQLMSEVFHCDHRYLLGLRTPCSDDFTEDAERISARIALPLRWRDVSLDHFEQALERAIRATLDHE